MATKKLVKYPKRPKASASAQTLKNYIQRCKDVDKKNAEIAREKAQIVSLKKQVAKIGRAK